MRPKLGSTNYHSRKPVLQEGLTEKELIPILNKGILHF